MLAFVTCALIAGASPGATGATGATGANQTRSIAVLDVKADARDAAAAALFSRALAEAAARQTKATVIAADELRGLLDAAANQALLGCADDPRCAIDRLRNALTVDELVVARIGSFDAAPASEAAGKQKQLLAFISLVDTRTATVLARASTSVPASGTADAMRVAAEGAATRLWGDVARASGDRLLADMRMALVLDEAIAPGVGGAATAASEKLRAVEACVQEQLVDANVALVAADSVAALRGVSAEQWLTSLSQGAAPSFLGSSEVDAVIVARVEYTAAKPFAGAERADADMSLRLVQTDTGTIIAAKQLRAAGNGFNANGARKEAAKKLCADVRPLLAQALDVRRSRGSRVVVEVRPANVASLAGSKGAPVEAKLAAGDAEAIAAQLARLPHVARARVARYDEKSATLELVVSGGDGVSLALDVLAAERGATSSATSSAASSATSSGTSSAPSSTASSAASSASDNAKGPRRSLRVVSAEPSMLRVVGGGAP